MMDIVLHECRVGLQLEPNDKGLGVLGVVEADFLTPTHNKQDFDDTPTYRSLLAGLLSFTVPLAQAMFTCSAACRRQT